MGIITDRTAPADVPSTNVLVNLVDPDDNDVPPAYLSFGSTPTAYQSPPQVGEKRTYVVRVECTGQSESVRTDGEHRYGRKLTVLWAVEKGKAEPPDPDAEQPSLFDETDDPDPDADVGEDDAGEDGDYGRPAFSGGTE